MRWSSYCETRNSPGKYFFKLLYLKKKYMDFPFLK